jgi:hypothetical protein
MRSALLWLLELSIDLHLRFADWLERRGWLS